MRSHPLRSLVTLLAFGLAFVVNPTYLSGCASEDEPDLAKIEAQMLEELDALNGQGALRFSYEGEEYELLLALTRRADGDESARAPGARFTSTAHACGTQYQLALEGTVSLRRLGENPATITADVPATGDYGYGLGHLDMADGSYVVLRAASADSFYAGFFEGQDLGEAMLDISYTDTTR